MKINLIAAVNGAPIGLSFGSEREITIGREIGSTIAPMAAEGLSRHHAKIYFKDGSWYVEDLGSTNGTYRGNDKIEGATALAVKDKLQFGRFEMSVDEFVDEEKSSTVQLPEPVAEKPAAPAPAEPPRPLPRLRHRRQLRTCRLWTTSRICRRSRKRNRLRLRRPKQRRS